MFSPSREYSQTLLNMDASCQPDGSLGSASPSELFHDVFVYGTLKRQFYNYEHVLRGKQSETATVAPGTSEGSVEGRLFVDRYYIPYLQLSSGSEDASIDHGLTSSRVRGEIFTVSSDMLGILDELEGIGKGRYQRSRTAVQLDGNSSSHRECWVYHLRNDVTLDVAVDDRDVQRNTENLSEEELRGAASTEKVFAISNYRLDKHQELYLPPNKGRDMKYFRSWGGYV
jgi:gamma-glutamylcyclotransferase (GGCT)/AIG2-like uncharacterized protein YtfP